MSRIFYCPVEVNNQFVSKEAKKWYAPVLVNGQYVSQKVTKAYCSVGGLSKLFYEDGGGGGTLVFEYDYQNYTQYSVHNYLTLDYVLDKIYQKLLATYGSAVSQYSHLQYFVNNWQSIKSDIVTAIENSGYNVRSIEANIAFQKANGGANYTVIGVRYGNDTYPRNVRTETDCKKTDTFGNTYYALRTASPTPPQYKRYIYATAYSSSYTVGSITSLTGNITNIGLYCPDSSVQGSVSLANFGMKVV